VDGPAAGIRPFAEKRSVNGSSLGVGEGADMEKQAAETKSASALSCTGQIDSENGGSSLTKEVADSHASRQRGPLEPRDVRGAEQGGPDQTIMRGAQRGC